MAYESRKSCWRLIRAFLHFSRPDKGPLRDYETWMPDMLHGMADSLKNNAYVLRNAARDVSSDLQTQMQYDVGMASHPTSKTTSPARSSWAA